MKPTATSVKPPQDRFAALRHMVGNTPLLAVHFRYQGESRTLYAKAEYFNMTGSIKDRMAFHVLRRAYETGAIRPGDTIVEATSGNTGIAFAAVGRALGHPVVIFMPDWMSRERVDLIRSLGARIMPVSPGSTAGFSRGSLPTRPTSSRTSAPPARKSGGSCRNTA